MDGTRRSPPPAEPPLVRAVARAMDEHAARTALVAVALSGGRDSVALLAAACEARPGRVVAIHVHHGLSPNADAWAASCDALAASLRVPLIVRRVRLEAGDPRGIEAAARELRYDALRSAALEVGARTILLAHHRDDQVETLLLQLGRGAGPHGLAAMPAVRCDEDGFAWLRPWLDVPRAAIEAYVREHALAYVDDESNAKTRHRRNAVRRLLIPAFDATFPGFGATLARSAMLQAEASRLMDDVAMLDASRLVAADTLDREGLAGLAAYRGRNLLRYFLRLHGLRAPSAARLASMHEQLCRARHDARVELVHEGAAIGVYRGRVVVHRRRAAPYLERWQGERRVALPHGVLHFVPSEGLGLARSRLEERVVVIRSRRGGERFQPHPGRPRRALKLWLQEARVPPWQRADLPLVFCDDDLAAVPGLGVDVAYAARGGVPGVRVEWEPHDRAR